MTEIRPDDIQYVLVTHADKLNTNIPRDKADVYMGILGEEDENLKFVLLKGWQNVGLKYGQLGHLPKKDLEKQIKDDIVNKIDTDYYFLEFHDKEDGYERPITI